MDYKSTDYLIHNQIIGAQFIIILLLFSVADPAVGGGGGKKHAISETAFNRILFYNIFLQDLGEGHGPLPPPPAPAPGCATDFPSQKSITNQLQTLDCSLRIWFRSAVFFITKCAISCSFYEITQCSTGSRNRWWRRNVKSFYWSILQKVVGMAPCPLLGSAIAVHRSHSSFINPSGKSVAACGLISVVDSKELVIVIFHSIAPDSPW